jgi:hypothetical protein
MIFSDKPTDPDDFLDKFNYNIEMFLLLMDYHTWVVGKDVWGLNEAFQFLSQMYSGIMQIFILIQ